VFNVFNNNSHGTYSGLTLETATPGFGVLAFDYNTPNLVSRLDASRGLIFRRRQLQFGIRFSF
jgi:hypothetical protein